MPTTDDMNRTQEQTHAQAAKRERAIGLIAAGVGVVLGIIALWVWL